mmetsp:Transcript_123963/g.312168  ORF Transcript_123963/g.312168 Transcript_123963/m.312168 type:complete len:232 (-) Transcript_123963:348-1043(-)
MARRRVFPSASLGSFLAPTTNQYGHRVVVAGSEGARNLVAAPSIGLRPHHGLRTPHAEAEVADAHRPWLTRAAEEPAHLDVVQGVRLDLALGGVGEEAAVEVGVEEALVVLGRGVHSGAGAEVLVILVGPRVAHRRRRPIKDVRLEQPFVALAGGRHEDRHREPQVVVAVRPQHARWRDVRHLLKHQLRACDRPNALAVHLGPADVDARVQLVVGVRAAVHSHAFQAVEAC